MIFNSGFDRRRRCGSSKLNPRELIGWFGSSGDTLRCMEMPTSPSFSEALGSEPRTLTALLLESIALRHQIAALKRSGTRRPSFRLWNRLF
ncbi:MAG: hypothetical protein WBQ86_25115 [Candidatus Binatus sp.]